MLLGFYLGYGLEEGPWDEWMLRSSPKNTSDWGGKPNNYIGKPKLLHQAKLGHTDILTRLLRGHGLFQGAPNTAHRVRCGRVFVRETKAGWKGAGCCTVSSVCTVKILVPTAGAFFQLLCLLCDYMCEQPEFMSPHRSSERLKFFIPRKWQERESSESSSQRLWGVKHRWFNSSHVDISQQQNASILPH